MESTQFTDKAHQLVGRLVFVFTRLEVNLALYVAARHGNDARDASLKALSELSFHEKLTWVEPTVSRFYPKSSACKAQWKTWVVKANRLRKLRNSLLHGRWAVLEAQHVIANVSGLPGVSGSRARRYSLDQLQSKVTEFERLAHNFYQLSERWPV